MTKFDFIFVVLIYKNYLDLEMFCDSLKTLSSYKVVVIESFFDTQTYKNTKELAEKLECDYVCIENRGYSFGNNAGIKYANSNYRFEYLVVSNPDIIVNNISKNLLDKDKNCVYGPLIKSSKGTNQNPYWINNKPYLEKKMYEASCSKKDWIILVISVYIKIFREIRIFLASLFNKKRINAFALHGSFIIFPWEVLRKIDFEPYDENMFLFCEELYLAHLLEKRKISSIVLTDLSIDHKEDGSMKLTDISIDEENRKSMIYYYEKMVKRN